MSNHLTAPPITATDLPAGPGVCALATTVLTEHTNNSGACSLGEHAWPDERVMLAEHNLTAL